MSKALKATGIGWFLIHSIIKEISVHSGSSIFLSDKCVSQHGKWVLKGISFLACRQPMLKSTAEGPMSRPTGELVLSIC